MPKYTKSDIRHTITEEEFKQIIRKTLSRRDRFFLALMYCTAARPSEIAGDPGRKRTGMKREDIVIEEDLIKFNVPISKIKEGRFAVSHRVITWEYDHDDPDAPTALKIVYNHIRLFQQKNLEDPLFTFCRKTGYNIVERASKVIGIPICPYNFRHSRLTLEARKGATIDELMQLKGSKDIKSLSPYIHASEIRLRKKPRSA